MTEAMTEHRITITQAEHGFDPENGERFLAGFLETHPETGPVVSQDTRAGTISVTFSVDAEDFNQALELALDIWGKGGGASKLPATNVVDLHVTAVVADELEEAEELQPA